MDILRGKESLLLMWFDRRFDSLRIWTVSVVSLLLFFGCGSSAEVRPAPQKPPPIQFVQGELQKDFKVSLNRAWNGLNEAIKEMSVVVHGTFKDDMSAEMTGKFETQETFLIRITAKEPDLVTIGVRMGDVGNELESKKFMDAIRNQLEESKSKNQ